MPNPFRPLRSALPAALVALSLAAGSHRSLAQATTVQTAHALGITLTQKAPYNFTGRIFSFSDNFAAIGSGTLIRRHTVLTAGHVVYDPTAGFLTLATFTRALYENFSLSKASVRSVAALSGYQAAVEISDASNASLAAFALDQGYLLLSTAPVDENWGNFIVNPALLTQSTTQFFVLGYPGVSFDGRTMAYIVPQSPYVQLAASGSFTNENYAAEEGMSGGPIYVVLNGSPDERFVAADTVGGSIDSDAEFNNSFVRAIDKTSSKFLIDAEYTSGLIKRVKVSGPKTVARGTTATFSINPIFLVPNTAGQKKITTNRYAEIKLKGTAGTSFVGIKLTKTSNTTYDVFVPNVASIRPGSQVTLQAFFDKTAQPAGVSSFTFTVQ